MTKLSAKAVSSKAKADLTEKVIALMKEHGSDWTKPWRDIAAHGMPRKWDDGYRYTGGNVMILLMSAMKNGYTTNLWNTFAQWEAKCADCGKATERIGEDHEDFDPDRGVKQERRCKACDGKGHRVAKGQHGEVLCRVATFRKEDDEGNVTYVRIPRYFRVFNLDQLDNPPEVETAESVGNVPVNDRIAEWVKATGLDVRNGSNIAAYSPTEDYITMPNIGQFESENLYWSTLFHEMTHATGHKDRLNRVILNRFGDEKYAAEELVAELGSVFLSAEHGIESEPRPDHAKYLSHWLKALKAEPDLIYTAAGDADKAHVWLDEQVEARLAELVSA